jgi:hypothetical protein
LVLIKVYSSLVLSRAVASQWKLRGTVPEETNPEPLPFQKEKKRNILSL